MSNKLVYAILNNTDVIALVYESEERGRTIVIESQNVNWNFPMKVIDIAEGKSEEVSNKDTIDFLLEMLPNKPKG